MSRLIIPQSGALLVYDKFSGIDGDVLSERVPDTVNMQGSTWQKDNTYDLTISSNNLETVGFTDDDNIFKENDHFLDVGTQDVTIESVMDCEKSGSEIVFQSILLRYRDFANHYAIQLDYIGNIVTTVILKETVNDVTTDRGAYSPSPAHDGTAVILKAIDDGSSITIYYNGISVVTYNTVMFNASTKVGIKGNDFNDQIWQYFKAWKT